MEPLIVTDSEKQLLKQYKQAPYYKTMGLRAEAILLLAGGVDTAVIGEFVDRAPSTIKSWARQWRKYRLASLYSGHAGNLNASKLTEEQLAETVAILQRGTNLDHPEGVPVEFWTVAKLAEVIYARFQVVYQSASSYHFLLHLAGLSFHKPEPVDQRRPPQPVVQERVEQIRGEIAEALADPEQLVFAADEVRVEHEAIIRRCWYQAGTTAKLAVDRDREAQSWIGFLNQNTGKVLLERLDWQNSTTIARALRNLVDTHPNTRITIVWDNAKWHKSKQLRQQLGPGRPLENIHLINLPPYAPDTNPIEHVWNEAKHHIANQQRAHFNTTRTAFETYTTTKTFPYRI